MGVMDSDPGLRLLGKVLLPLGALIAAAWGLLLPWGRVPWLGQLPSDIVFRTGRVTIPLPLATSILLSIVLTNRPEPLLRR